MDAFINVGSLIGMAFLTLYQLCLCVVNAHQDETERLFHEKYGDYARYAAHV